jgi:hypothetical protein
MLVRPLARFAILSAFVFLPLRPLLAADAPAAGAAKSDADSLEKAVVDAPGPVGCYTNPAGDRLTDCEAREKGLSAFQKLYDTDKARAIKVLQKRFDEIPSPKGGYFPILAAVKVKDKAFVPALKKLADSQKENDLGTFATEAARLIETGKCSQVPPPRKLAEICQ